MGPRRLFSRRSEQLVSPWKLAYEKSRLRLSVASLIILVAGSSLTHAQTSGSGADDGDVPSTKELHQGIIPPQDYGGDLTMRSHLTGDWGGVRSDLADLGIQFRGWLTPLVQDITEGGDKTGTEVGASGDLWVAADFDKMGAIPGGLLVTRIETDVGHSTLTTAGTVMAPSYNSLFPVADQPDENILTVSNAYYTQFFGKKFGAFAGRFDTHHNANMGEFAGLNRQVGQTQFMNLALTAVPVMPVSQPYVTSLGAGVFARPIRDLSLSAMVMDSRESSMRLGLDDFGKDWNAFASVSYQHRLGDLPGGQMAGFSYSWSGNYAKLDEGQLPNLVRGLPLDSQDDTWAAIYSGWQYLQVFEGDTTQYVNTGDGRADHRGWGVFLIAGLADEDTNPVQWSLAGGVGGRGILPGRPNDQFGIGYYHIDLKGGMTADIAGLDGGEQGVELYYEAEVVPWFHLTPDVQVIDPGLSAFDTAVILGLRGHVAF
jgi:porin